MFFSLFGRPRKGPIHLHIDPLQLDLNINVSISDQTGLAEKLGLLSRKLDESSDELQSAVDAAQP